MSRFVRRMAASVYLLLVVLSGAPSARPSQDSVEYVGPVFLEATHDCLDVEIEDCADELKSFANFEVRLRAAERIQVGGAIRIGQAEWLSKDEEPFRNGLRYGWPKLQTDLQQPNSISADRAGTFSFEQGGFTFKLDQEVPAGELTEFRFREFLVPPFPIDYGWGVWIKPSKGPIDFRIAGRFELKVTGTRLDSFELIAPSLVKPGQPFEVTIAAIEGRHGYESSRLLNRVFVGDVELSVGSHRYPVTFDAEDQGLRTVSVVLENLGVQRLVARRGETVGVSNRVVALPDARLDGRKILWGALQNHSAIGGHAASTTVKAFTYARDVARWDFISMTEHENLRGHFDIEQQRTLADAFNQPGRFVTLPAFEVQGEPESHRHVVFPNGAEMVTSYSGSYQFSDVGTVYRDLAERECLIIPHHTAWLRPNEGYPVDHYWAGVEKAPGNAFLRLFEVYSWHGFSDVCPPELSIQGSPEKNRRCGHGSYYQELLARGWRLGAIAGTDGHLGLPGSSVGVRISGSVRYALRGLTGVLAASNTREEVFRALAERRTWGTTGARIVLISSLHQKDHPVAWMGSEVQRADTTPKLKIRALGTAPIVRVLLYSGEEIVREWNPGKAIVTLEHEIPENSKRSSYNVKLFQADGERAWSSPIWIDRK